MLASSSPKVFRTQFDRFRTAGQAWSGLGAAKRGSALLAGILRCRRCGRKLMVRYTGSRHDMLRYACYRGWLDNGEPPCIGFGGLPVDEAVAREILRVVQPGAVEAAVVASEQQGRQHD